MGFLSMFGGGGGGAGGAVGSALDSLQASSSAESSGTSTSGDKIKGNLSFGNQNKGGLSSILTPQNMMIALGAFIVFKIATKKR